MRTLGTLVTAFPLLLAVTCAAPTQSGHANPASAMVASTQAALSNGAILPEQARVQPMRTNTRSRKPTLPLHTRATSSGAANAVPHSPSLLTPGRPAIAAYNNIDTAGLNASDNTLFTSTPPDSTGSIGPSHYVELVNSVIGVYRRADLSLVIKAGINTWLNQSPLAQRCDPQIQWDPSSGRWLYVVLECGTTDEGFLFGWSKTSDPSDLVNGWCRFSQATPGVLPDYPKLGHNAGYMMIGANGFDSSSQFVSAEIYWMATPAVGNTSCTAPAVNAAATPLHNGNNSTLTTTPVPVNSTTNAADGYILSAYDPSGGSTQSKLAVWRLDSAGTLHQESDLSVDPYSEPAPASQPGTNPSLDTLDGRLTQAVGDPSTGMWTQHTVNGPGGRSVAAWYEVKVASLVTSVAQQGVIASGTDFVFNAAISPRVDALGASIFYNRSGTGTYPLIAGQTRISSTAAGQMEPGEIVLGTSSTADNDFSCLPANGGPPCRWGDYSGASPDPVNTNVVWGSNQVITANTATPAWASFNFAVIYVGTATNVAAAPDNQSALVTWTPPPADPGTPVVSYTVKAYVGSVVTSSKVVPAPAGQTTYSGLTNGVTYTFTVTVSVTGGSGPESGHSNPVTPTARATFASSPVPAPTREPAKPASPAPLPSPR